MRERLLERLKTLNRLIYETDILRKGIVLYKKPIREITRSLTLPPFREDFSPDNNKEEAFEVIWRCIERIKRGGLSDETVLLEEAEERLRKIRSSAEQELGEKGIMYIKVSVCLALLFVVIMI